VDWNTSPFITAVVAALASLVAAAMTHSFARTKNKADVHASIASGAGLAVDTITDVLEQVRQELEDARIQIEALRSENGELRRSIALLNMRISDLSKAAEN
jgi:cell shape-determining protein MreC